MPRAIPIGDRSHQRRLITLNRKSYYIEVFYNDFYGDEGAWFFDLSDVNDNPIISGRRILPYSLVTGNVFKVIQDIQGVIVCVNTQEDGAVDISRDNFGTGKKFQLWFYNKDEVLNE